MRLIFGAQTKRLVGFCRARASDEVLFGPLSGAEAVLDYVIFSETEQMTKTRTAEIVKSAW